jgi:flagellar basal-body rod modification protein FlgD
MTYPISGVQSAAAVQSVAGVQPTAASGTTGTSGSTGSTGSTGTSLLDPQAFLQLLVAQLQYQDPTNPVDTSTFMNQTAMLSQVQSMNAMSATLTSLVADQQAQAATNLIGKKVTYADSSGIQQTGLVTAVTLGTSGAVLHLGDTVTVPLSGVLEVTAPSA